MSLPSQALPTVEVDEVPPNADVRSLSLTFEESQVVGTGAMALTSPDLSAVATLAVTESTGDIVAEVAISGLNGGEFIASVDLRFGFAGENGGVLASFAPTMDPDVFRLTTTIGGLLNVGGNTLQAFLDGAWYIDIATGARPSGQLRAQALVSEIGVVRIELQGAQENPPVANADGIAGVAYATFDALAESIVLTTSVEGFVPFLDAPVGPVHLHAGFAGENGPVILPLQPVGSSQTVFRGTEADAVEALDFAQLLQGGYYVNVHSMANASGEVRGQLVPNGIQAVRMELEGQQENPPVMNAAGISGVAYATLDEMAESIVLTTSVEGFVPFLDAPIGPVHLHAGFAGENGPVILPLQPVGDSDTVFRGTEVDAIEVLDFAQLLQGGCYINVHSAVNASGEVRGQLVPGGIQAVRVELEGQQENPPVANDPGVLGVAYATFDAMAETIVLMTSVEGFVPFLDAPVGPVHLHAGFAGENGPVILPLQPVGGSNTVFRGTEADAIAMLDFGQMIQGGYYINVHSAANASGEVRGQVVPSGIQVIRSELQGAQENPPVSNAPGVFGVGYATFNAEEERIVLLTTVEGFVPFLDAPVGPVHLHAGFAGENGPVILPLQPVGDSDTMFRGTEAEALSALDFALLLQGGYYINVHSAENASGEVRGQIVPSGVEVVRMELQGAQENPSVSNGAGVSGVAFATFNAAEERIVLLTTVEGFVPFLDAPIGPVHLHAGLAGENGPVILPLQPVGDSEVAFRGTETDSVEVLDFEQLLQGGHYINVHSEANPMGEVRGQLLTTQSLESDS
ncbi:MAG: CHRD domain-containing protein [Planctomycetota bacterium]